jgi:hypothetical protein
VIGIEDWHINSAESNFFEYGSKYSGQLAKSKGPSAPRITIPCWWPSSIRCRPPGY